MHHIKYFINHSVLYIKKSLQNIKLLCYTITKRILREAFILEVISYKDIFDELIKKFANNQLIPVIGSGFTLNCESKHGNVPSGTSYKNYMLDSFCNALQISDNEKATLNGKPFSEIAGLYIQYIDENTKHTYFLNHFSDVIIKNEDKLNFLNIEWPYIYTLNIDDGIEKNSQFSHVISSNRKIVSNKVFDEFSCVIKLHGDINEIVNYHEYSSLIFSKRQYGESMNKNKVLLTKLKHDAQFNNLIFIGCSLADELDILVSLPDSTDTTETDRYICVAKQPSQLEKISYEQYGITHIIVFDSYNDIYSQLYAAWKESQKIRTDELDTHKNYLVEKIDDHYENNKSYYFFGKSLFKNNHINQPFFFISRDIILETLDKSKKHSINIILGNSYSGKTYLMCDLVMRIRNKDVYAFESKDRIADHAFSTLLNKSNSIFLFDTNSLNTNQIETLIRHHKQLELNQNRCFIFSQINNGELHGLIHLLKETGIISETNIGDFKLDNRFSENEVRRINPLMARCNIGILKPEQTLLDNVISISEVLEAKHKFSNVCLSFNSIKEVASLVILAIEKKVYSTQVIKFDILSEIHNQYLKGRPLIDLERTWSFESSASDNPNEKYIINAEYWLNKQLGNYASRDKNQSTIVKAFKYIISKIVELEGKPEIIGYTNPSYKRFIQFDIINRVFYTNGKNSIFLIKKIYDGLNEFLSNDPNYLHQRAKCYIRLAYYTESTADKEKLLNDSMRYANIALGIFSQRFDNSHNEKISISSDHVKYTLAVIACHKCYIHEFNNTDENSETIIKLTEALASPYNSYDYAKRDYINYKNVVYKTFTKMITSPDKINDEAKSSMNVLYNMIRHETIN